MVKERGLDNLVWAYSPGAGGITPELFAERYPGDEIIDMVGFDCYQYSTDEVYIKEMKHALDVMSAFNEGRGKIMAVTETGYEGIPNARWWTDVLYHAVKDYPVSYVLTWRNACDEHMQHHFYGPYPGHLSAENFKEFAELEKIELL
jgi:mannan endo-1,4-beta-mannosidase